MTIFIRYMKKKMEIANISFEFEVDDEIRLDNVMEQFVSNKVDTDYFIKVKIDKLPKRNKECLYSNYVRKYFDYWKKYFVYYRLPNESWQFCLESIDSEKFELIFIEECKSYVNNIYNLINKIEIGSLLLHKKAAILHSSYIIHEGKAIVFTAPSGIGKSTQADLWMKYRNAEIINGDRSVIRKKENEWNAFGLPFSGSSGICLNKTAPLRAIVVLGQSKTNIVYRMNAKEAFMILFGQFAVTRWSEDEVNMLMSIIMELIKEVPILKLECLPDESAVIALEEYLRGLE